MCVARESSTQKQLGMYSHNLVLVLFKAQLGEALLEILIFFCCIKSFLGAKPALKTPKPALKRPNRHKKKTINFGENQKGTAGRGREKKCHDNLRQTSRQFTTFYDNCDIYDNFRLFVPLT